MSESTFILVELGKLMSQSETTTRTLDKLSDKVSRLGDTVKAARIVGTVLIGVVTLLAGAMWWLGAALWPVRQKLVAILLG